MQILLIRHGEPVTASSEVGPVDPELTERGRWQAERLGDWLACEPIDALLTSDQRRAIETAAPLAQRRGLTPRVFPGFAEIDRNARFYASPDLLPERFPEYHAEIQAGNFEQIGWDSFTDFRARVLAAWQEVVEHPPGDQVAIACHGGTIGVILSELLGIQAHRQVTPTPFASVTRVDLSQEAARLITLHETAHFDSARAEPIGPDGQGFPEP